MYIQVFKLTCRILFLSSILLICQTANSANDEGASDLGVDYAFMSLMTLSPDFAAANYAIHNDGGSDVDITIGRIPYHIDLMENDHSRLQMELAFAYQRTEQIVPTFTTPGENIDSEWNAYGAGLGILYGYNVNNALLFTPSLRFGVARMVNHADYNGALTNLLRDQFDGTLFNWETNTRVLNLGIGLEYKWTLLDRSSSLDADVYHIIVGSFNESNPAVDFNENANMIAVKGDMVFPTGINIHGKRLDFVLVLGANDFFGQNRHTLGYTVSYQAGIGAELPIIVSQKKYGYIRISGHILWANNMEGWLLTAGFNSE